MLKALELVLTASGKCPLAAGAGAAILASGFLLALLCHQAFGDETAADPRPAAMTMSAAEPRMAPSSQADRPGDHLPDSGALLDYLSFQGRFVAADPEADVDGDGRVDSHDFREYILAAGESF